MTASMTIAELETLIGQTYALDAEIDAAELAIKPKKAELARLEALLMEQLQLGELTSYKSKYGTVVRSVRYSVQTPKTKDDKQAFFGWLGNRGEEVRWQYTSVNSQSLNALYKAEMEIAREEGNIDFRIPGIGEPSAQPILSRRK